MKKRLISGLLALVLVLSALPVTASATETTPASETEIPVEETVSAVATEPVQNAAEHVHKYTLSGTVAPTCTAQGYTTYLCAGCGDTKKENYTSPLEHDFHEGTCTICGDKEEAPAEPAEPGDVIATGICGSLVEWVLTGDGKLTISGKGAMQNYTYTDAPWYGWRKQITSVAVENGVTSVGDYAFYDCMNMGRVTLASSVVSVGKYAFAKCASLKSAALPSRLTAIGEYAFSECVSLESMDMPSGVKTVSDGLFFGCSGLNRVMLSLETTSIGIDAFKGCARLPIVTLAKVTTIGSGAFADCISLTLVNLPESVTTIGTYAFSGCTGLNTVNMGKKVTAIGASAFSGCTALTEINIPKDVAAIDEFTFYGCAKLPQITLPAAVKSVGYNAFAGCAAMEKIFFLGDVPAFDNNVFDSAVTATGYFPKDNATWTASVKRGYGGNITWQSHVHDYKEDVTAPTCLNKGFTVFTCKDCGYSYTGAYTDPVGHKFTHYVVTTAPTCTEKGMESAKCDYCGEATDNRRLDAIGHSFTKYEVTKAPTCTEKGVETAVCDNCGKETNSKPLDAVGHSFTKYEVTKAPTCTEKGVETAVCDNCGEATYSKELAALGHQYVGTSNGTLRCTRCEEVTNRIAGSSRCHTALLVADAMKGVLGVEKFDAILYASGDNSADALAGSYLSVQKKAPILLYRASSTAANLAYIQENLKAGGMVYILGGTSTIPAAVDAELTAAGIASQRLAGGSRYATNLEILKAAGFAGGEILVCTSQPFADSLSVSASGKPILLVNSTWEKLSGDYVNYLADKRCTFTVIGGKNSVTEELQAELGKYGKVTGRVSGTNRYLTSLAVAERFAPEASKAVLAYAQDYPDGLCGGPLAYFLGAPLILTDNDRASVAAEYTGANAIAEGMILGGTRWISEESANRILSK